MAFPAICFELLIWGRGKLLYFMKFKSRATVD